MINSMLLVVFLMWGIITGYEQQVKSCRRNRAAAIFSRHGTQSALKCSLKLNGQLLSLNVKTKP